MMLIQLMIIESPFLVFQDAYENEIHGKINEIPWSIRIGLYVFGTVSVLAMSLVRALYNMAIDDADADPYEDVNERYKSILDRGGPRH